MLKADRHVAQCLAPFIKRIPGYLTIKRPKRFDAGDGSSGASFKRFEPYRQDRRPKLKNATERHLCSNQDIVELILEQVENVSHGADKIEFAVFANELRTTLKAWNNPDQGKHVPPIFESLRQAYIDDSLYGLVIQIKYFFHGSVANKKLLKLNLSEQKSLVDLRYPVEWYPATRMLQRTIHLHVGPTNSGKTYAALKRLEQATSGIFAGPLRLLAHEVYTRLNKKGKACNLITGDERLVTEGEDAMMSSCTVEMVPLNCEVDVAVIDEIQMIGDEERGWAWTQALLGVKAKELHLCGETRTVPLIRELASAMGDKLEIHHYKRLSPLKTMASSLDGNLKNLRKGDCVVAFSRISIHALKRKIEQSTKKQVAVVYGSLPPETRTQQARLFNDPHNNYDFLVASDAIGMGLNLSIKRIIFESTVKFNGRSYECLPNNQIKQIAGRAGRYRTAIQAQDKNGNTSETVKENTIENLSDTKTAYNLGLVTALEPVDLSNVIQAMDSEPEPIMSAVINPPLHIILRFATYFPPNTPLSYILLRLHELSLIHPRFRLCALKDSLHIADLIHTVPNLSIRDRITFTAAPIGKQDYSLNQAAKAFARRVANNESGELLDIPEIELSVLNEPVVNNDSYLNRLESLHQVLTLYLWLSYSFLGVFTSQSMAFYVKELIEARINEVLAMISSGSELREEMKIAQQKALLKELGRQVQLGELGFS